MAILHSLYHVHIHYQSQLYTADGDKKLIFPIMFEDIDFDASESGQGVKFVISAVNWTMCRSGVDDYNNSISRLMIGMKAKGKPAIQSILYTLAVNIDISSLHCYIDISSLH